MRRTQVEADATRAELRLAALVVFAERGYAAASLEEIASRARVTRGALYHHYAGKAELYLAAIGEAWSEVTAPIFAELDGDDPPLERVERFLVAYARAIDDDRRFRDLLTLVALETDALPELEAGLVEKRRALEVWLKQLEEMLIEAASCGELRADLPARQAALAVLCFINGITTTAATLPGLIEPGRQAAVLARVLVAGMER